MTALLRALGVSRLLGGLPKLEVAEGLGETGLSSRGSRWIGDQAWVGEDPSSMGLGGFGLYVLKVIFQSDST